MRLTDQLTPAVIKIGLQSEDKEELFEEMVQLLIDAGRIKDRSAVLEALFERESKMTTGIGQGIALPHGKVEGLEELVLALGVSRKGIEYDAMDHKPVRVVLMVLAEEDNPGAHIEALAEVSRLFSVPGFTERLCEAKSPEAALELIRSEE